MIGGVTRDVDGKSETFRLTTRAMEAIEDQEGEDGAGIVDVLQKMETGFRVSTLTLLLAEAADDGRGRDRDWARAFIDKVGVAAASDLIAQIAQAAFPEAAKTEQANAATGAKPKAARGNGKRASRS